MTGKRESTFSQTTPLPAARKRTDMISMLAIVLIVHDHENSAMKTINECRPMLSAGNTYVACLTCKSSYARQTIYDEIQNSNNVIEMRQMS